MQNQNCFIEFDIQSDQNFADLKHIFDLLKEAKNNQQSRPEEFWLANFPEYSLKHFYFIESDKKPTFQTAALGEFTWHFYSLTTLLDTNYEIEYSDCYKLTENLGRLEYLPYSYPYGGITGLIVFISSFNCKPTIIDDGTSLYKINFMSNGDFSIIDLNDSNRQDSSVQRFNVIDLLKKFLKRFS